jgi:cytochrome c oxidase subunit 1
MTGAVAAAQTAPRGSAHPAEPGFLRTYVFATDHKMIGRQFMVLGLAMLLAGGLMALAMRWHLAWPDEPVPGLGWVPEPHMFAGRIPPTFYNSLFTMHATLMVFFAVTPILIGGMGNFLIPLMIGARDMAFPVLNMLSIWIGVLAAVVTLASMFVPGGGAASGWTAYPPLSARPEYTGVGLGQDLWIAGIAILSVSMMMGGINYITTIVNMRAPGMTFFRMPLVIWFLFITAILALFAFPVLMAAGGMLLADRLLGTSFFLPAGGGQPILWQHLFWFFGHPEVYILVLPALGAVAEILPVFARKPVFGYRPIVWSLIAASALAFIVWGHHMFTSGMNPLLGTGFSVLTIAISVPFTLLVLALLATLWRASIRLTAPMAYALGSLSMFITGGLSGIFNGSPAFDLYIHDTYFVVGHFHYIIFGSIGFGVFAAVTYWFPKMFGRMMGERLGLLHAALTFVFTHLVFFPMHLLGLGGHVRRIHNPAQYDFLQPLLPLNRFITWSALALGASQLLFAFNFVFSLAAGRRAVRNPWEAATLEWTADSPPPHGNWIEPPSVHRGPYEYSPPGVEEDFVPQDRPPAVAPLPAPHPAG